MKITDVILECLAAVVALAAMNHFVFHDSILTSALYAIAVVASFWVGRLAVRLVRARRMAERVSND